jgi:hypothetical protein
MALDAALKSAGVPLPPAKSISALRLQLAQAQEKVPPPLALLFSMAPGKAKLLAAEDKQGWYIVKLGKITPGNAATRPDLIQATQQQMGQAPLPASASRLRVRRPSDGRRRCPSQRTFSGRKAGPRLAQADRRHGNAGFGLPQTPRARTRRFSARIGGRRRGSRSL